MQQSPYDAIVDSSIKQVESFAQLVSAVAKPVEQFAQENVTDGQARGWLVEQYPHDVTLVADGGGYKLAPLIQPGGGNGEETATPTWLADFGAAGADFTAETLEGTVLPEARKRVAQTRMSTLSTMVLLGMQRVVIKDGSIGARLRFRAAASDNAAVQYATSNDPGTGGTTWGGRGSDSAITKVATVGVNVQSDTELSAQLFGDVKINFASETLPLDRFVDDASRTLLERHSRSNTPRANTPPTGVVAAPAVAPVAAAPAAVAAPAPAPAAVPPAPRA